MPELYPLKFNPIYKEKIWGGRNLADKFNKNIPQGNIGESWEVSVREKEISFISNGPLAGKSLKSLLADKPKKLMGKEFNNKDKFPLLIKFLDAHRKLSVQVHPTKEYSENNKKISSKTEMWYIIDAKPEAKIVYGVKPGVTKKTLNKAIKTGELGEHLREINVKPGEFYFIPGGTVHAIEEGIFLAEIQQNSDTTYRLYDWDRKDEKGRSRPLHIEQAFATMHIPSTKQKRKSSNIQPDFTLEFDNYTEEILTFCPYFAVEKINLKESYTIKPQGERFYILMNISDKIKLETNKKEYEINKGETTLIPAKLDQLTLKGNGEFLKIYIPQHKKEIVNRLTEKGFDIKEIEKLPGINYFS